SVTIDAPASVEANTIAVLTANVGGFYAADVTSIYWTISAGALDMNTGSSASWTSPRTTGPYTISVSVTDGLHTIQDTVTVAVTYENCTAPKPCTIITNIDDLQDIQNNLVGHYYLVNDIDASDTANWDSGKGFAPIGDNSSPFKGILDGQGHTIDNLYINRPNADHLGLFGVMNGSDARIEDLGLKGSVITGDSDNFVGGIIGAMADGTITNVYNTGTIKDGKTQGGIVGVLFGGTIQHAYNTGTVT